jgi:release factor glutamine methyltransferase
MSSVAAPGDGTSPLPCGERSREARVRGVQASSTHSPSPRPSPHRGEGETVQRAFVEAVQKLREAGIETPELDARLLLCHAAGLTHEGFVARAWEALLPDVAARLDSLIERRVSCEPVSRITGAREFYGRSFLVHAGVLDPRPDTEILIEAALDLVERAGRRKEPLRLLDLGTGTGCILLTLLAELPQARGLGTDLSLAALRLAEANAARLGVASRASFLRSDWLDGVSGEFDLIVANPPYIASAEIGRLAPEVALHDPHLALDGGPDGLDAYRRIAAAAGQVLAPKGQILVEIGAAQGSVVTGLLREKGFLIEKDSPRLDLAGRPRVVVATI